MSLGDQFSCGQKVILDSQSENPMQVHGEPGVVVKVGEQKARVELINTDDPQHDRGWFVSDEMTPVSP